MTKDEALVAFFRSLRVAFKNAAMYQMSHPAFIRCVEDLKRATEEVFPFLSPLSVGFTPRSLYAGGRFWEDDKTYRELGLQFHLRKIKSIEIRAGVTLDELMRFSSKLTLPPGDFIRAGGAADVLKKEKILHIAVEELDYGELLKGEGEEIKHIWPYLLQEAVEGDDEEKIKDVAASFERVIGEVDVEDLVIDENLGRNFSKLFYYLKKNEATKYRACAKTLIKSFVTNKDVNPQSRFDGLKPLIEDLSDEDFASTLWEEIVADDHFDALSFNIFSRLLESDRHRRISDSLSRIFQSDNPLNRRAEVEEKIKTLLSGAADRTVSEVYQRTLNSLLKNIRFDKKIVFDHGQLNANYRYILLNILAREKDVGRMAAVMERILERWEEITRDEDFEFMSSLQDILLTRRQALLENPAFTKISEALGEYVERAILEEKSSPFFDRLISGLADSRLGKEIYLQKIIGEGRVTSFILRAYYRFFKERLDDLTSRLKEKREDRPFLDRLIGASASIDSSLSLAVLKSVYDAGDESVRVEALKGMERLSEIDKAFLFSVLRFGKSASKGEALALLIRRPATKKRALDRFLRFQSPYGIRNKRLKAHIRIVEEKGIKEAADHIGLLSQRKSIWNRSVRREARNVLERWNESRH